MARTPSTESIKLGELVSIFLRGKTWYANYQVNGKQHRVSLKTRNKHAALRKAHELETQILAGQSPRKVLKMLVSDVQRELLENLKHKKRAASTLSHYNTALTSLVGVCATQNLSNIAQVDLRLVDDFANVLRKAGLSEKTVSDKLSVVRSLVLFAYRRGYLDRNPLAGLRIKKPKCAPQPYWEWDQVQAILRSTPALHCELFTLLAYTGMRIGEALHLEWSDVDFKNNVIHIRVKEYWQPKSGESRMVPMTGAVAQALKKLSQTQSWVFARAVTRKYGRPCTAATAARSALDALRSVLKQLGLPGRLHTFRHSFITYVLIQGEPEAVVRRWVGHVDPAIIRLYTHVGDRIAVSRLNQLFAEVPGGAPM